MDLDIVSADVQNEEKYTVTFIIKEELICRTCLAKLDANCQRGLALRWRETRTRDEGEKVRKRETRWTTPVVLRSHVGVP
jgi:hypothetical protein